MKISQKVPLVASTIVMLAFTVFAFFQFHMVRDGLYKSAESNIAETSLVLSHQVTNWLNGKLALIDMMAQTFDSHVDRDYMIKIMGLPMMENEFLDLFGGFAADGKIISPTYFPGPEWDARKRPWYPRAQKNSRAVLTEPYEDFITKNVLISVVANLVDNGKFVGAFGGDLSLKTVSDAINTLNFNHTGYAFMIDAGGKIISHPDTSLNGKDISTLFTGQLPKFTTRLQEAKSGDTEVLTSFRRLDNLFGSEWLIGVVLEKDKVMADAYALSISAIIGAIISAILSSLILYLIMRSLFLKPIERLTELADQMSRGKLKQKIQHTSRSDEIGGLALAIERMGVSLTMALERLRKKRSS